MDAVVSRPTEEVVKSLVKVAAILDAFSTSRRAMSLAEIAAATGFPHSTTHRLAASMREVGLLDQDRHRDCYRLGLKLFQLGNIMLANMDLYREARSCRPRSSGSWRRRHTCARSCCS